MSRRVFFPSLLLPLTLMACTALKVVTHSVDDDPVAAPGGSYRLDKDHWSLSFDVAHLGYSRFVMRFDKVTADLDFEPLDPEKSRIKATIDAASFDSNVAELDRLVEGPDLLDARHDPSIRFESVSIERTGAKSGIIHGLLTIKGVTRPLDLATIFNGGAPNPLTGLATLGFSASGQLALADYGLDRWVPAIGDSLAIHVEAEFGKTAS